MKNIYNWKLITMIIVLFVLFSVIISLNYKKENNYSAMKCVKDNDCAPKCSCHPDSCVSIAKRGNCSMMICSQECSGPLDCNAGYCGCVNNKCQVISNIK